MKGYEIQLIRKTAGLTLKQFGKRIGVAESTVCRYESGTLIAPYSTIKRIKAAFNVDPAQIEALNLVATLVANTLNRKFIGG